MTEAKTTKIRKTEKVRSVCKSRVTARKHGRTEQIMSQFVNVPMVAVKGYVLTKGLCSGGVRILSFLCLEVS